MFIERFLLCLDQLKHFQYIPAPDACCKCPEDSVTPATDKLSHRGPGRGRSLLYPVAAAAAATVTNYHQLNSLKYPTCIVFRSWSLNGSAEPRSFCRLQARIICDLFRFLGAVCVPRPLALSHVLLISASIAHSPSCLPLLCKGPCDGAGPPDDLGYTLPSQGPDLHHIHCCRKGHLTEGASYFLERKENFLGLRSAWG